MVDWLALIKYGGPAGLFMGVMVLVLREFRLYLKELEAEHTAQLKAVADSYAASMNLAVQAFAARGEKEDASHEKVIMLVLGMVGDSLKSGQSVSEAIVLAKKERGSDGKS